jgi:hypothetical protein
MDEKYSLLDPLTQEELQPTNAVQSKLCKHLYSRSSIQDYMRKERAAERADDSNRVLCPQHGCKTRIDETLIVSAKAIVENERRRRASEVRRQKRARDDASQRIDDAEEDRGEPAAASSAAASQMGPSQGAARRARVKPEKR